MVSRRSVIIVAIKIWFCLAFLSTNNFSRLVSARASTTTLDVVVEDGENKTTTSSLKAAGVKARRTLSSIRPKSFLLGVKVDAGRHNFPVDWLESFMNDIHRMDFNCIHLTLTNDQRFAFTVKDDNNDDDNDVKGNLSSSSSTTTTTTAMTQDTNNNNNTRYTVRDLKFLAQHAQTLDNLTIIPEVSIPFYAASWVGSIKIDQQFYLAPPPCPRYLCAAERAVPVVGTNLPLDIRHPQIEEIVRSILRNLVQILDNPPYLHLGPTRKSIPFRSNSDDCWKEVIQGGGEPPDYYSFEKTLAKIVLNNLGYQPQVIRGVVDGDNDFIDKNNNHTMLLGKAIVSQYQDHHLPRLLDQQQHGSSFSYILQPKQLNIATTLLNDTGWDVYQSTIEIMRLHQSKYKNGSFRGIIISTEAMHPHWFDERNVKGRLLAISMAVRDFVDSANINNENDKATSHINTGNGNYAKKKTTTKMTYTDRSNFEKAYISLCDKLFPDYSKLCHRLGGLDFEASSTDVGDNSKHNSNRKLDQNHSDRLYKKGYMGMWKNWADKICHQFTETREKLELQTPAASIMHSIQDEAFASFWQELNQDTLKLQGMITINSERTRNFFDGTSPTLTNNKKDSTKGSKSESKDVMIEGTIVEDTIIKFLPHKLFERMRVPFRGLILDLVDNMVSPQVLQDLMEQVMVPLGLNTLQLSLMNRVGCSLQLESLEHLYHLVPNSRNVGPLSDDILGKIIRSSERLNIELIPEISVTTQATGWYHAGFLVDCPNTLCDSGEITNDVNRGSLLPVVLNMIRKIRELFHSSSFIHLGSDERNSSQACWKESGKTPNYTNFEERLSSLLMNKKWYNSSSILRWENREGVIYPERTGGITHYQFSTPVNNSTKSNVDFFGSLSVNLEMEPWAIYQETRRWVAASPRGILAKISLKDFEINKPNLVAFALGISSEVPIMKDPTALNTFISDICDDNSYLSLIPLNGEIERVKPTLHSLLLCKAMTRLTSHSVMRSHVPNFEAALKEGDQDDRNEQ